MADPDLYEPTAARLLEQRVVLLVVRHARVVEDDDARRMPVVPEVLVVGRDRLAHVAQPVGRDDEDEL